MYKIGDKIVYPMHGAGIIRSIEKKEIFDEEALYYSVDITTEDMDILIPVEKAEEVGLRHLGDDATVDAMMTALAQPLEKMLPNWSKRYQANLEKLKTGNLAIVAGVVRNLTIMDRTKGLSSGEKRMLFSAKNFLISEMMMIRGMNRDEADRTIEMTISTDSPEV